MPTLAAVAGADRRGYGWPAQGKTPMTAAPKQIERRRVTRVGVLGGLLLAAVAGYLLFQTMTLQAARCEVCMQYKGQSKCRTVGGANRDEAMQGAINNACAFLAGGVTDSLACSRTPPVSQRCW